MRMRDALKTGLAKTKALLGGNWETLFTAAATTDRWEEWESLLLAADMGYAFTSRLLGRLKAASGVAGDPVQAKELLREELLRTLIPHQKQLFTAERMPLVVLVIGVNGTGKTTTIGKLGARLKGEGYKVMFCAGDTFRSAAVEQLTVWGERAGIPVVAKATGADPAAVVFEAVAQARAAKVEVLLVDTAGRVHTKNNLMEELKKIKRVVEKDTPPEHLQTLLVLDATTGQNALHQSAAFHQAVGVDAVAITKLDGSAKGGIVVRVAGELQIPLAYIGVGEGIADLRPFDAEQFVSALLD